MPTTPSSKIGAKGAGKEVFVIGWEDGVLIATLQDGVLVSCAKSMTAPPKGCKTLKWGSADSISEMRAKLEAQLLKEKE